MHISVLLKESIEGLNLKMGDKVIDCTFGDGGHTREILRKVGAEGCVLAIDTDKENIVRGKNRFGAVGNLILVNENFVHLKKIAVENSFDQVQAVLLDLGWSSTQFTESGRGFSFLKDEPLDMRLGQAGKTAAEILNYYKEEDLGRIFREYGEERQWKKMAKAIVDFRKRETIKTSGQLAGLVEIVLGGKKSKIHPATKIFQALRIAVNDELRVLRETLPQVLEVLAPGGRLAIISFHSLEDRIVKRFLQTQAGKIKIINKKPITPSAEELKSNPRSRSAKLRLAEKKYQ